MNPKYFIGWDIGGAHVKAAIVDQSGHVMRVFQQPCPLWKGLGQLRDAVTSICQELPLDQCCHAMTMTGELVDLFDNRSDGVKQIIATVQDLLAQTELLIFAGNDDLLMANQITHQHYSAIASSNWLASAAYVAQIIGNGVFVDIGSTTTDILLFKDLKVRAQGYTDYQRLISGELVYTGIIRTAIMAVAQTAIDDDQEIGLMAEYFATMADVYRLTGELNEAHDQTDTADGAEKTVLASARRLSRMIGCDFETDELPRWRKFAEHIRGQQINKIEQAITRIENNTFAGRYPLVGAGVGRFLVKPIAANLGCAYLDFADLTTLLDAGSGLNSADCAPAVAVAYLAKERFSDGWRMTIQRFKN